MDNNYECGKGGVINWMILGGGKGCGLDKMRMENRDMAWII